MRALNKDAGEVAGPIEPSDGTTLNVGMYPYVPQPAWFEGAISTAWAETGSPYTLNFVYYDCYGGPPPATVDVFAFDTVFAAAMQPYTHDLPGVDMSDFYGWAPIGLQNRASGAMFALPYLGCMATLIYRADDAQLVNAQAMTVADLEKILGDNPRPQTVWPPANTGLIVDLTGGTTVSCDYLQSVMETANQFPLDPPLPACPAGLDPTALTSLQTLVRIAGRAQAAYADPRSDRIDHFAGQNGQPQSGRAYVGLTESLNGIAHPELYTFRPMPLSTRSWVKTIPMYCDALAVNAALGADAAKLAAAIALVNTVVAATTTYAAMVPPRDQPDANPQFLIPVRPSVMSSLANNFPVGGIYPSLKAMLAQAPTAAFRIGAQSYGWLAANKSCIRSQVLGPGTAVEELDEFAQPGYASTPAGLLRRP